MGALTTRQNVVVMADEAHRTQYGLSAKVQQAEKDVFKNGTCVRKNVNV